MPTLAASSDLRGLLSLDLLAPEAMAELLRAAETETARRQAEKCRRSLAEFVRAAWPIVEPSPMVNGWHVDAICSHLEAVTRGEIRRLLICIPPRHGKSLLVSVLWPAWIWTHTPQWRSLFVSHSASLAVEHSRLCRQLIESPWYRAAFGAEWSLATDQNAKDHYSTTRGGHRFSIGMTGGITGHGGDLVAIDDPISVNDAMSDAALDEARRIVGKVLPPRLNDQNTGRMLMIMQRVNMRDPAQFWLDGGNCEALILPSEFVPQARCVTRREIEIPANGIPAHRAKVEFWRDPRTEAGEPLCADRFPPSVLAALKAEDQLGADGYATQHQQSPTVAGGGMFRVAAWRVWRYESDTDAAKHRPLGTYDGPAASVPMKMEKIIISVDATFRETAHGSFVSIQVWGKDGARRYLLDRDHRRLDFEDTRKALLSMIAKWPTARERIIEGKANGDALCSTLEKAHGVSGIIRAAPGTRSKEERAHAMLPYQRAGNIYLPDGAPWIGEYIAEHAAFPRGANDDDVDAQSQALEYLETTNVADYLKAMNKVRAGEVRITG